MTESTPDGASAPVPTRDDFKARLVERQRDASSRQADLDYQVTAQLNFLRYRPGDRVVIESLKPKLAKRFAANWFAWATVSADPGAKVTKLVNAFGEESVGLYIHADTIRADATARLASEAWTRQAEGAGFTVGDVTDLRVLKIDVDPTREGGTKDVSANATEMKRAVTVGARIYLDIAEVVGADEALAFLFSGNGVQVHVALDRIENAPGVVNEIKRLLFVLDAIYSGQGVTVDTSLWDPRRLVPLAGTLKRKGANDTELGRVHRLAWIAVPPEVRPLPRAALTALAAAFDKRLSSSQTEAVEAKLNGSKGQVTPSAPSAPRSTPDSELSRCDAVPIRLVAEKLGIDPDSPKCPVCGAQGSKGDTSVRLLESENCLKCLHATCGNYSAHPIKLVAKVVLGLDTLKGDANAVRQVVAWFEANLGVVPQRRPSRASSPLPRGSDGELTLGDDESSPNGQPGRATIRLSADTHRVVDDAVGALASNPEVYVRGNVLARVLQQNAERGPVADALTVSVLRSVHLSRAARWESWDDRTKAWRPAKVPEDIARAVHELHEWPSLRRLNGIADTPIMRRDGSVLDVAGYDEATGLLYLPKLDFLPVPDRPSQAEIDGAMALLFEVVADFPLVASGRAAWLAMLLSFFGRPMFNGPAPGFAVDANNRGIGKGLLCDVTGRVCAGRSLSVTTPTDEEEELRKRITSTLIKGAGMVLVDNLPKSGEFGNATWDALFTAESWEDRVLGVSENVTVPNNAVWVVTGNNIRIKGDTTRRLIHVRLETEDEHPERRDPASFKHPDLRGWVARNRPRLVQAALTLLRAWVVAGRPRGTVRLGSYESWAATVGACVQWLGLGDVTDTQTEYERRLGDTGDGGVLRPLLAAWQAAFVAEAKTASEVLRVIRDEDARVARERRSSVQPPEIGLDDPTISVVHRFQDLRDAIIEFSPSKGRGLPDAPVLGKRLGGAVKQVAGGRRLVGQQDRNGIMHWSVVAVAGASGGTAGAATSNAPAPSVQQFTEEGKECGVSGGISGTPNVGECQPDDRRSPGRDHLLHDRYPAAATEMPPLPPQPIERPANPAANAAGASTENAPALAPAMPPQIGTPGRLSPSPETLPAGRHVALPRTIERFDDGLVVEFVVPPGSGALLEHLIRMRSSEENLGQFVTRLGWRGERDERHALVGFDAIVELDLYYVQDESGRTRSRVRSIETIHRQ